MRLDSAHAHHPFPWSPDLSRVNGRFPDWRYYGCCGAGPWLLERHFPKSDPGHPWARYVKATA